jgi:predicted HAD superfamily Cof-like phosphohydrolase
MTTTTLPGVRSVSQRRIDEFMQKAGQDTPPLPCIPDAAVRVLRAKLIFEEAMETIRALGVTIRTFAHRDEVSHADPGSFSYSAEGECNITEVADGCADIAVVTTGTLSAFGIPDVHLQEKIDRSNLAKFGPGGYRRDDGKWIKPPDWQAPDILGLLIRMGFDPENPYREQFNAPGQ